MNNNGEVVHSWDQVEAGGRARLLRDGRLLVISVDGALREYDWSGKPIWEYRLPGEDFAHHDLIQLENGNNLVLAHDQSVGLDYMVEVTASGDEVWKWHAGDHLEDLEASVPPQQRKTAADLRNWTHINSMHELPPNK